MTTPQRLGHLGLVGIGVGVAALLVTAALVLGKSWWQADPPPAVSAQAGQSVPEARAVDPALERQRRSRTGLVLVLGIGVLCAVGAGLAGWRLRAQAARELALQDLHRHERQQRQQAQALHASLCTAVGQLGDEMHASLQGVQAGLSLLRRNGPLPPQSDPLRRATAAADHLQSLVDEMRDLALLDSGQWVLAPAPLEVRAMLQQMELLLRPRARSLSLGLLLDAEPSVPAWIVADGPRLQRVLVKLLSTAMDAAEGPGVTLDVQVTRGDTKRLAFVVSATVSAEQQKLATAPTTRAADEPLDIGSSLEVSRRLARQMGGDITLTTVPGEGRRVRLELPLQATDRPAALSPLSRAARKPGAAAQAPAADPPQPALTVLVAEDHPVNRQYLASLMETLQHNAHFVANGREAVAAVKQQRFDLVLMDLHMPELDGIGAALAIRAMPDRAAATVPIVALTADTAPEMRDRCRLAGMNDFLTKPVSPQGLATALRRLFGHEAADAPAAEAPTMAPPDPLAPSDTLDAAVLEAALPGMSRADLSAAIHRYLDQGPLTVAQLRNAVRDAQPLALRAQAQAVGQAASRLGLAGLARTAQALHDGATHLPAHEIARLVQNFDDLLPRTRQAVLTAGLETDQAVRR